MQNNFGKRLIEGMIKKAIEDRTYADNFLENSLKKTSTTLVQRSYGRKKSLILSPLEKPSYLRPGSIKASSNNIES